MRVSLSILFFLLSNSGSLLSFRVNCPIASKSANPDHQNRLQVNATVVADRHDGAPLAHFVYDGKRSGSSRLRNLLVELQKSNAEKGLLVVDRDIVNKQTRSSAQS